MGPLTAAKVWLAVKPIKRIRQALRNREARKKTELTGTAHMPSVLSDSQVEAELNERLDKVVKAAPKSWTMRLGVVVIALGTWVQTYPEAAQALMPDGWEGLIIAIIGGLSMIARSRTLGK